MYSFSKLHWYEKTHLGKQNHTKNYWNLKCAWQSVLWPNHTLARCVFFYQYCLRGNWYIYMCHSNFIVLLPHISPWTQSWIQAFIEAYENLTFKSTSFKQNCCFRNQRWDAVKSRQALKKVASNRPIRMQYLLPEYIKLQSELVQRSTFFWLVYLQTSRHATQFKWIGSTPK